MRMTPHKSLLEYDMIEPSKLPWASGVVMAKKKGDQVRFCCHFRYLNSVTEKDAYPIPRIDENLSKLGDAFFFSQFLIWARTFGKYHLGNKRGIKRDCLQAGIVPMEEDDYRDSHTSATNGTGTDKSNQENWKLGNEFVLRGRRGDRYANLRGSH